MTQAKSLRKECRLFFWILLGATAVIRCLISAYPRFAAHYPDDLLYLKLAQNLRAGGGAAVYASPLRFSKLLYPLIIAPFYAIENGPVRVAVLSVWNALLLSSALVPGYLLACEVLKSRRAVMIALILLALAPELLFSQTFFAENLYIPLLLWGFLAAWRVFSSPEGGTPVQALILGMLCWLLFFTKEIGLAFSGAVCILWAAGLSGRRDLRSWLSRILLFIAGGAALFVLTGICLGFDLFSSYTGQLGTVRLQSALEVHYLLYAAGMLLLYFGASVFFFPVLWPMLQYQALDRGKRKLLLLTVIYAALVSAASAYAYSVPWDAGNPDLNVYLRYLSAAAWPLLLLFLSLSETETEQELRRGIPVLGITAIFILLFLQIPRADSLLQLLSLGAAVQGGASVQAAWVLKIVMIAAITAAALGYRYRRRTAALCLAVLIGLTEAVSGGLLTAELHRTAGLTGDQAAREAAVLDAYMDSHDGPFLMVTEDSRSREVLELETFLRHDHAMVTAEALRETAKKAAEPGRIAAADTLLPADFYGLNRKNQYDPMNITAVILERGAEAAVLPDWYQDVTPEGLESLTVLKLRETGVLHIPDPLLISTEEPITFHGENPGFLKLLYSGFYGPEAAFTWTEGTEASLEFAVETEERRALRAELSWVMTSGQQEMEILIRQENGELRSILRGAAEGNAVSFMIPADAADERGHVCLYFRMPGASVPGNGDPRILAYAFRELKITPVTLYQPGEPIGFTEDDLSCMQYDPTGFSPCDGPFTWTDGTEAALTILPDVAEPTDMDVRIDWVMMNGAQRMEILAGEETVFDGAPDEESHLISFRIPKSAFEETGVIRLRFLLPDAREPGNGDPRQLGVAFRTMWLEPVREETN